MEFIRISASEYVYGSDSTKLTQEEYKQKMRMSTSIIDLIENASITYDAPDHKKHKLFPDGFKNYQGRVGIDATIFKYIVRVGKAKNGKIFYDICLEVDGKVPRAKRTSLIKSSTSTNSIPQNDDLSTQNSKIVPEGKASRELDTEYLSAVERGDMERAQKMVDEYRSRIAMLDAEEAKLSKLKAEIKELTFGEKRDPARLDIIKGVKI